MNRLKVKIFFLKANDMSKKTDEYRIREKALHDVEEGLKNIFETIDIDTKDFDVELAKKYVSAHDQILKQALKFDENKEYEKALPLFIELAEHYSSQGAYCAAQYYEYGKGVEVSLKQAFEMYKKAMENGSIHARYIVGYYELIGKGTIQNIKSAIINLEAAAFFGDEDAIYLLIDLYDEGRYVEQDFDASDYWREKIGVSVASA